jgi:hypothetical protein
MKWRTLFAIAIWAPGRSPPANSPDSTCDDNSGPYPLGRFRTCPHSQLCGVSGQCPTPELAKRPAFNAVIRRGNCELRLVIVGRGSCPSRKPHPAFSGSKATLLPPRPLRTRRASFPAARSSLSNAPLGGRDASTYDCCCVCAFFFADNARDGFHR